MSVIVKGAASAGNQPTPNDKHLWEVGEAGDLMDNYRDAGCIAHIIYDMNDGSAIIFKPCIRRVDRSRFEPE